MNEPLRAEPSINSEDIIRALLEEVGIDGPPTDAEAIVRYLGLTVEPFFDHVKLGLPSRVKAFLAPSDPVTKLAPG